MGPGIAIDAAQAAAAGTRLRSWGAAIGASVERVGLRATLRPPSLAQGAQALRPIGTDAIRTIGWELRSPFFWHNDARCVQRASFGAMSLIERSAGTLDRGLGELARGDAHRAAMLVAFKPSHFPGNVSLHAATVARGAGDDLYVIDHLVSSADDGVMPLGDWMRRIGASPDHATILPAGFEPPSSLRGGVGIPSFARTWTEQQWKGLAGHLADSWSQAAAHGIAAQDVAL